MKNWARWTLVCLWFVILLMTCGYWNPFASIAALLKYSVVSVFSAIIFGAAIIIMQFYIMVTIMFPLPPRADAKAPKPFGRKYFKWLYKDSPIDPKAPAKLDELIGQDQARQEIREVIDMLQNPAHYVESGTVVPKGLLFIGPPGVGKTLFARAIANECGVPFYVLEGGSVSGIIMGLGVIKLKMLFSRLAKHEKAILFIDEIDSLGSSCRSDKGFGGQSDMNMTLNTLLTQMDGFHGSGNLLVIGATNNDGVLDPALMRPGRMDRRIYFQTPGHGEREGLFNYYLNKVKHDGAIDLAELSMLTSNYSPAEIANVVNEAALISMRPGGPGHVTMDMLRQALDRVAVGLERTVMDGDIKVSHSDPSIRLDDVIGIDDVKQDIIEIVDFLKHGDELRAIGAKIPKGVLMIGPPGVGKTMLAKAIANEAGVPFFGLSASYLQGGGSDRIQSLYRQARKSPAAIIFIDEIDSIGAGAGNQAMGFGSERTSALNQILIELDGIGTSTVITIGATNVEDKLDSAFTRSGRFDRKTYLGLPDANARKLLFSNYLKKVTLAGEIDLEKLAKMTTNFSGADVNAAVNEAAILAVRKGKKAVDNEDLEEAAERISITAGAKLNVGGMNLSKVPDLDVRLTDIKGMDEAKAEAAEVVALLKHSDLVTQAGLKAPKGVLLVGSPGTGKTMLAKAIANEAGVPFYSLSGGDFQSMWAGVGSNRVRVVYEQARRAGKPCIVFIDEIDAIGGRRGVDYGGGAVQDSNKTLNQLLVEMDGYGKHKVLTIGATNNAGMLDDALLRQGRFDRQINIPRPNLEGREAIFESYLKKCKTDETVRAIELARMTTGSAGADIRSMVNEAGLMAIRDGRTTVSQNDLFMSIQRIFFGMQYSRKILTDELRATAYHEAGHATVCYYRHRRERIQVLTITPRGGALGYLWTVDKEDYVQQNKHEYLTDIEVGLGGYAAETLTMDTTTSGVSSDLSNVGWIARNMVRRWGMGTFKMNVDMAFGDAKDRTSSNTSREIELEIKQIVDGCLTNVMDLLKSRRAQLDQIAQALLEKETLHYKDIARILEPDRTEEEIERELVEMGHRTKVGPTLVIDFDHFGALTGAAQNGGNGKKNGTSNGADKTSDKKTDETPKSDSSEKPPE